MIAAARALVLVLVFSLGLRLPAQDPPRLKVVVTLPYIGEVVREIGGGLVGVVVLLDAGQDPHDVQVSPGMTGELKEARLFIENGMTLESFTPRLLAAAGEGFLLPGQGGHAWASDGIVAIEKPDPAALAAGGHVHAAGNPHIWLDPVNLKIVARNIEKALGRSLYQYKDELAGRRADLEARLDEAMFGAELVKLLGGKRLEQLHRTGALRDFLETREYRGKPLATRAGGWWARARKLPSKRFISFHKTWSYFEAAFGLEIAGTLEEKPGIPPSPAHLAELARIARDRDVRAVIAPPYYPRSRIEGFAAQVDLRTLVLPSQPGEEGAPRDLFGHFDRLFELLESVGAGR